MILSQIDDTFFKILENPEAWGLIGLFLIAFMVDRYLGYRFYKQAIHKEQTDQDADNEIQQKLITLIGGTLEELKKSLDNNTRAFKEFALSHNELETRIADTNKKLEDKISRSNYELKEAIQQVLLGINGINDALSDMKGNNSQESKELRLLVGRVEKIIRELPNGNIENPDSDLSG